MKQLGTWQEANYYQNKGNDSLKYNGEIPALCRVPMYVGRHLKWKGLGPGQTRVETSFEI